MDSIERLVAGYKEFFAEYFSGEDSTYEDLTRYGQFPRTLIIACSDSRVDPSIITRAQPGEIFVIRNVANLIPPYQPVETSYHGTSAALEFAVCRLHVEHIIILGHSQCAGIRALVENGQEPSEEYSFITSWMQIARDAREKVLAHHPHATIEEQSGYCEEEALRTSLENIMTFPWVAEKCAAGVLSIHAWHFHIASGKLRAFEQEKEKFVELG